MKKKQLNNFRLYNVSESLLSIIFLNKNMITKRYSMTHSQKYWKKKKNRDSELLRITFTYFLSQSVHFEQAKDILVF